VCCWFINFIKPEIMYTIGSVFVHYVIIINPIQCPFSVKTTGVLVQSP